MSKLAFPDFDLVSLFVDMLSQCYEINDSHGQNFLPSNGQTVLIHKISYSTTEVAPETFQ